MIQYGDQLKNMIKHEKITHARVKNFGKKICDIIASTPESFIQELDKVAPSIKSYGKLTFWVGDETTAKANFGNAIEWLVSFPDGDYASGIKTESGTMTKAYADLMAENMMLKMVAPLQAQIKELQAGNNKGDDYMQYLPFVAPMLGMKDDDMLKRLQMSMMIKNPAVMQGMLAGAQAGAGATGADADKKIGEHLESISKKVKPDVMLKLVTYLDSNPGMAATLVGMIPAPAPGMAGAEQEKKTEEGFKPTKCNPMPGLYLAGGPEDMF